MKTAVLKQQGIVLVFALLVLLCLTILGVSSVSSSLMQSKMAQSMESYNVAFDAAEAGLGGVIFESEDLAILSDDTVADPLTEARQGTAIDPALQELSCFDTATWTNRRITSAGVQSGVQNNAAGTYSDSPAVNSWSSTAFVDERPCLGSSNVVGGSNISCHIFIVKGCGQVVGSGYAVANSLNVSVFAPATNGG
ncbi:PilX N-terminal domain-containing pilus assembly protein [Neptunicella sp. SCSIO 80796]|uniref:PilX N-terminal domain-containing pilus assembly protein n=1 Tax=Neptunicella plasticusilytica TaxID=3117012 RepID=UPI003A4D9E94